MHGFQLWANLPSSLKMTTPRYQDVAGKDIPEVDGRRRHAGAGGVRRLLGHERPGRRHRRRSALPRRVGAARQTQDAAGRNHAPRVRVRLCRIGHVPRRVGPAGGEDRRRRLGRRTRGRRLGNRSLVLFDRGDEVTVQAGEQGIRFLLVSGKPIEEPVAWYGPIVMNTEDELRQAVAEMRAGTFIKTRQVSRAAARHRRSHGPRARGIQTRARAVSGRRRAAWQTVPGVTNSAANLALHVAGNLQYFIGARPRRHGLRPEPRGGVRPPLGHARRDRRRARRGHRGRARRAAVDIRPRRSTRSFPKPVMGLKFRTSMFLAAPLRARRVSSRSGRLPASRHHGRRDVERSDSARHRWRSKHRAPHLRVLASKAH